jgi:hypothetical protein
MVKERYLLDRESLSALASLQGGAIGFVGSPSEDFRDTWQTWGGNIILEVAGRDYYFGADEKWSNLEAVAREIPQLWVRPFDEFEIPLAGFPRFDWWRGLIINEVLIARDTYSYAIPEQTGDIVMDRAIILITERKSISISLVEAHDGADLLLAHEPTIAGRLGMMTQPAARDLGWVDNLEHSRQIVQLADAKGGR